MPATVRDILLMIRAKEDVTRTLAGMTGAMHKTQAQANAASSRARAAALRAQATQAAATGATRNQVMALRQAADAQDEQARAAMRGSQRNAVFAKTLQSAGHVAQTSGILMAAAGAMGVAGLKNAVDVAAEWEKQVRLTFTQVDKRYKPSLRELSDIGLRVSSDIAVPFETIQQALFDVFSSTEANMPQAEQLLRSFAKAAVAGQTDVQTASRATVGLMNSFKVPFKDVNKLLDIQFQLVQEGVGTYEEWANRIGLVSPSAARAGQSVEMMAAALATATRSGMNAARASTSVARAFDAMSNPKTEKALSRIGVKTRDAKGNFRPLVDVLGDWRKELEKMPKEDRVKNILETLKGAGGTIEARRFLQNVLLTKGGLELFQDQVKEFSTDKGAFQRAYGEMADTALAKSQLLHNAWMRLKQGIGEALLPAFSQLVGFVQRIVNWFNQLSPGTKSTIAQFVLWGSVLMGFMGIVTLVVGALVGLAGIIAVAGTAILPVLGIFAGIAAIVGVVAVGVLGLGAAFVIAYQKSENFRRVMSSIWALITQVGGVIKAFALGVWSDFNTYVMPSLRNLWSIIESQVLPRVRSFVDYWRSQVVPMLQVVAGFIRASLIPAWKTVANVIDNEVRPALVNLIAWWDKNKQYIIPVGKALLVLGGIMLILAGAQIAFLIRMLALLLAQASRTATVITTVWEIAKRVVSNSIRVINLAIAALIVWFSNLARRVTGSMTSAWMAVMSGAARIRGVFAGAASWLINAGANIVQGLINGIRSRVGAAAQQAANLAKTVMTAAMGALGISSPSKVFRDIGVNIVRGLTEGIKATATRKQLQTAMFNLTRDVRRSIDAADISKNSKRKMMTKWNNRLASATSRLNSLEAKRATIQTKLAAAQKSVNDQIKARDELAGKIKESLVAGADLTTLTDVQKRSSAGMISGLGNRLVALQKFQTQLRDLANRGLDKETVAQLAQQGVDSAGALVNTLAQSGSDDLKQISYLQGQIRKLAGDTGTKVAGDLYNAGIKAGQGLVKGLQSQISVITKQMTTIATALIKAIKKELGIRSPSKVFANIGVNTAQGYVNGYVKRMNSQMDTLTGATEFTPGTGLGYRTAPTSLGTVVNKTYDIKQTIYTNEISPVKTAADLGWELQGRIN
jgi:TP901 family phage tail tape measure protein